MKVDMNGGRLRYRFCLIFFIFRVDIIGKEKKYVNKYENFFLII